MYDTSNDSRSLMSMIFKGDRLLAVLRIVTVVTALAVALMSGFALHSITSYGVTSTLYIVPIIVGLQMTAYILDDKRCKLRIISLILMSISIGIVMAINHPGLLVTLFDCTVVMVMSTKTVYNVTKTPLAFVFIFGIATICVTIENAKIMETLLFSIIFAMHIGKILSDVKTAQVANFVTGVTLRLNTMIRK